MAEKAERRRSPRFALNVALKVGLEVDPGAWRYVEAYTVEVNFHGGLMEMGFRPSEGSKIRVVNPNSGKSQECRVVKVSRLQGSQYGVAFEFGDPSGGFWSIPSLLSDQYL